MDRSKASKGGTCNISAAFAITSCIAWISLLWFTIFGQQQQGLKKGSALILKNSTAEPPHPNTFAFVTLILSNDTTYMRWAALQHHAAAKFIPGVEHTVFVGNTINVSGSPLDKVAPGRGGLKDIVMLKEPNQQIEKRWVNQLTKTKLWTMTEYEVLCYLDSDVVFFTNITASVFDECGPLLLNRSSGISICGYEEAACNNHSGYFNMGNREKWGMPYMEASIFCLRPDVSMYRALLDGGVEVLQETGHISMKGLSAYTEQDFLNLYFKGRIHYIGCAGGRGQGSIIHSKSVEQEWVKRERALPYEVPDEINSV